MGSYFSTYVKNIIDEHFEEHLTTREVNAEKELQILRSDYSDILEKYNSLLQNKDNNDSKIILNEKAINDFVTKCLNNPDLNVKMIPDPIERKIYKKLITLTLKSIGQFLTGFNVDILGHELNINLVPKL